MLKINHTQITLVRGSLLDQDVEMMVNANNCRMRGGSGINGMFHKRVGPQLLEALSEAAPHGAPTAKPVITSGFELCRWILHVAGPVYTGDERTYPEIELYHAYWNCFALAGDLGAQSLGTASLSTGIYGFPLEQAAPIAVAAALDAAYRLKDAAQLTEIRFAMYGAEEYAWFEAALTAKGIELGQIANPVGQWGHVPDLPTLVDLLAQSNAPGD